MLTTFVCINCGEPSILRVLSITTEFEYLGIEPCKCKGDPALRPKKETNITSLTLYREKRMLKEPGK